MTRPLARWLLALDPAELAALLIRRQEALDVSGSMPADLVQLADLLAHPSVLRVPLLDVPVPATQVMEVVALLSGRTAPVTAEAVAGLMRLAADDAELAGTLAFLRDMALVVPVPPEGAGGVPELHMAPALRELFPQPLRLGRPAQDLLTARPAAELKQIAGNLGLPAGGAKAANAAVIAAWLGNAEQVRRLVDEAPAGGRAALRRTAATDPIHRRPYTYDKSTTAADAWAVDHALVIALEMWSGLLEMPEEVGLALRGPGWRPDFDARQPDPPTAPVDAALLSREAAVAATALVELVGALLDACGRQPVALLKSGGVGARELKRLGKALGCEPEALLLALELAYEGELLSIDQERGTVLPGGEADGWSALDPARRYDALAHLWTRLPVIVLSPSAPAPLLDPPEDTFAPELRTRLLAAAADTAPGRGVVDPAGLAALVRWRSPLLVDGTDGGPEALTALWDEAELLGLASHGALTPLGRALAAPPAADCPVLAAARELLPPAAETAVFQTDLTVLVAGSPSAALLELLDLAADRETRAAASIWRVGPGSVRRALDSGVTAGELADRLRAAAKGGALPQPLEYLIADVARRHGRLRVRAVGCVLRSDDSALLAELAAARALRPLGLALLAPNVLSSSQPAAQTLAALRAAGYAPAGEDADGVLVPERVSRQRAPEGGIRPQQRTGPRQEARPDPLSLATALLAAGIPANTRTVPGTAVLTHLIAVAEFAAQLSAPEQQMLCYALAEGAPVTIRYRAGDGEVTRRTVDQAQLDGDTLLAWCYLRDDERHFKLGQIISVS